MSAVTHFAPVTDGVESLLIQKSAEIADLSLQPLTDALRVQIAALADAIAKAVS